MKGVVKVRTINEILAFVNTNLKQLSKQPYNSPDESFEDKVKEIISDAFTDEEREYFDAMVCYNLNDENKRVVVSLRGQIYFAPTLPPLFLYTLDVQKNGLVKSVAYKINPSLPKTLKLNTPLNEAYSSFRKSLQKKRKAS